MPERDQYSPGQYRINDQPLLDLSDCFPMAPNLSQPNVAHSLRTSRNLFRMHGPKS
jgi:hypothetical protein